MADPVTDPVAATESSPAPLPITANGHTRFHKFRTYVKDLVLKDPSKGSAFTTMLRNVAHGFKESFKKL